MPQVCFYLQLHQPYRLTRFEVDQLGQKLDYFADEVALNKQVFQKVAKKSYYPMLLLIESLVKNYRDFYISFSCSGVFIEQAEEFEPEIINTLKRLAKSGQVEFLAETYYHSLAALYSPTEFSYQVKKHREMIRALFGQEPLVFRNTELIYSNDIANLLAKEHFLGALTEGVDRYLGDRARTSIFVSRHAPHLPLLLKHAQLSDDLAFRFSDHNWSEFPLSVTKYISWLDQYYPDEIINLFMDFETFGEHQWEDSGIFSFFADFVPQFLAGKNHSFKTPSQLFLEWRRQFFIDLAKPITGNFLPSLQELPPELLSNSLYDVKKPISWADIDRDLTAWLGNSLQTDAIAKIYELEPAILAANDAELASTWRKLQTSDHFYYMCTKWSADGDVHAYFSPYGSPYEAYRRFAIVLADLQERLMSEDK